MMAKHTGTVVVVAGGTVSDPEQLRAHALAADVVVAADSGTDSLRGVGVPPNAIVGDMDSLDPASLDWARANGAIIERYPSEKDETDLQLALEYARDSGYGRILLFGVLGGRLDHTLGNLSLLEPMAKAGLSCWAVDGNVRVVCVIDRMDFHGRPGDLLSLVPLDGGVGGITTEGLKYPLRNGTLSRGGYPSGVSNVLTAGVARVRLSDGGTLLAVHTAMGAAQETFAGW